MSLSTKNSSWLWLEALEHRNRSDFCDLRLRCPTRTPDIARFRREEKAMLHCDLSVRWKVASDLRFRAAISEPKTSSFCGISGDLAQSTRKSLAIAIVRFWCAKLPHSPFRAQGGGVLGPTPSASAPPGNGPWAAVRCREPIFWSIMPFCLVLCLVLCMGHFVLQSLYVVMFV